VHIIISRSGVLVTQKGSKFEGGGDGYSYEDELKMLYLDIPVKASFSPNQSGFNIQAGVQPSVLMNAKQKTKMMGDETDSQKVTDNYKTLDVAAVGSVRLNFDNGLQAAVGYDHGITDINKNENNIEGLPKTFNRVLRFSLGYNFNQGKDVDRARN